MMRPRLIRLRWLPLVALATIPLGAGEAHAQFGAVGFKGGINWTSFSGGSQTDGGSGFNGGVYVAGQSGTVVAQFEVLLSKRSFTDSSGPTEVKESFIQIPALFGARGGSGTVNAMLYAGPSVSFKSACDVNEDGFDQSCRSVGLTDRGTLWSVIVGLSIDYRVNRVVLLLDGRYDNGLTNAFENRDGKWRSWVFMAGIGFLVPT